MNISTKTKNLKKKSVLKNVGIFSLSLAVASTAVYLYSPVIGTHADSSTAREEVTLSVKPGLGLRVNADDVELNATIGSFVHNLVDVDVITNSIYGYTLTLENSDNEAVLHSTDSRVTNTLTSYFSGSKTSSTMEVDNWGFSIDGENYYKVPLRGNPVALRRTNTVMLESFETTTVDFGARTSMELAASTYADSIVFTAYVNGQDGKPTNPEDPDNPPDDPADIGD